MRLKPIRSGGWVGRSQALAGANLHRSGPTLDLVPVPGVVAPQGAEAARKGGQDKHDDFMRLAKFSLSANSRTKLKVLA